MEAIDELEVGGWNGHWQGSHSRSPWLLLCHHGLLVPPWAPRHRVTMGYLCYWEGIHSRSQWFFFVPPWATCCTYICMSPQTCVFIRSSVIRSAKGALTCMCERSRRLGALLAERLRICIFVCSCRCAHYARYQKHGA